MAVIFFWIVAVILTAYVEADCARGWVGYADSCYYLHSHGKYDWVESMGFCESHNAHLAYIEDQDENDFIKSMVRKNLTSVNDAHVWLGATDEITEGLYLWYKIEKPITFTEWGPGEPNSHEYDLIEDCLVLWQDYDWQWADLDCREECYFVCEKFDSETIEVIG